MRILCRTSQYNMVSIIWRVYPPNPTNEWTKCFYE